MNFRWQALNRIPKLFAVSAPDLAQQVSRIRSMERNLVLPVKGAIIVLLFYYLFYSKWLGEMNVSLEALQFSPPQDISLDIIRRFYLLFVIWNLAMAAVLIGMDRLNPGWVRWATFVNALTDAVFLAALTVVTGGFDSILYWVFLIFILRNAVSTPFAVQQIGLNLFVSLSYFLAGAVDIVVNRWESQMMDEFVRYALEQVAPDNPTEPFLLRLFLLLLMTACCYGVQVLLDKQRRVDEEAREYQTRQQQLQATGRLAAEIAHQLKNPLGIINNAAFTLQRTVKEGKTITQQIQMIREEVERSDRIITELMGYAQLTEGRVEKLDVTEELESALKQVFPAAAKYEVEIQRDYAPALPVLLMQRNHLSEVLINILQNAREALDGKGVIRVSTRYGENFSVVIEIADNGPGIAPDKVSQVFEPYFTTKEKGTGLGLAIVKHNTEIYGGHVEVDSELGNGTTFTIVLPAKTLMKIRK